MEISEVIRQRFSARAYRAEVVDGTDLTAILQAACDAPSAGNLQAYDIVIVRDARRKQELVRAALDQTFIAQAPVVLVFCTNPEHNRWKYRERGAQLYAVQDATVATTYAQLMATSRGLATCWVGAFDEDRVREIISAPATWRPVAILPIGVPAETAPPRQRRPLDKLVHQETARR